MRQIDLELPIAIQQDQLKELIEELGGEWDPANASNPLPEGQIEQGDGFICVELTRPQKITIHVGGNRDHGQIAADRVIQLAQARWQAVVWSE